MAQNIHSETFPSSEPRCASKNELAFIFYFTFVFIFASGWCHPPSPAHQPSNQARRRRNKQLLSAPPWPIQLSAFSHPVRFCALKEEAEGPWLAVLAPHCCPAEDGCMQGMLYWSLGESWALQHCRASILPATLIIEGLPLYHRGRLCAEEPGENRVYAAKQGDLWRGMMVRVQLPISHLLAVPPEGTSLCPSSKAPSAT